MIEPIGPESRPADTVEPAPGRRPGGVVALVLIAVIVSGLVSAGVTLGILRYQSRTNPQSVSLGSNVRITEESAIISVAAKAAPAVVAVVTDETSSGGNVGSGFLITSDGYLVTSTSVLAGARNVTVLIPGDTRRHDARIVDADCQTALAILKVDGVSQLPTLAFADVSNLAVGQTVIAMGTPLEPRFAVSKGIVSALHGEVSVPNPLDLNVQIQLWDVTETDANIGAGNSGGPLLNVGGQVVGLSFSIASASDRLAFAVSSADIQSETEQIVRDGTLVLPSLAATVEVVSPEESALKSIPVGGLVRTVVRGGASDVAGIRPGDIVTALDEVKLTAAHPLGQVLRSGRFHPDQRVTISLVRGQDSTQVQVTLERGHPACG